MANTMQFDLEGRHYDLSAPTALQLSTFHLIVEAYYKLQDFTIPPPRNIVDVGACIGKMSLTLNCIWPEARIVAIEPHPVSFEYLKGNCAPMPKIECLKIAASDKEETFRISLPAPKQKTDCRSGAENIGMASRFGTLDTYAAEVNAKRLDDIIDFPVDFLKIDVEGMEIAVLNGARRILTEDRPHIQIEIRKTNQAMAGFAPEDVARCLDGFGYSPIGKMFGDPWFTYHGIKP